MRGVYQTVYLDTFTERLRAAAGQSDAIDIGRAFDLVVGTSTGGIVACALAAGIPLAKVRDLYSDHGTQIFPYQWARALPVVEKFVRGLGLGLKRGDLALRAVLTATQHRKGDRLFNALFSTVPRGLQPLIALYQYQAQPLYAACCVWPRAAIFPATSSSSSARLSRRLWPTANSPRWAKR